MKSFLMKSAVALSVGSVLGFQTVQADPKNLAVEDISYSFVQEDSGKTTIRVDIKWQKEQFKSIYKSNNSVIEPRFYRKQVEPKKSQELRLDKDSTYTMEWAADGLTLDSKDICPEVGSYQLRTWLTVRHNDKGYSRNDNYGEKESTFDYDCIATKDTVKLQAGNRWKPHNEDAKGNFKQFAVLLEFYNDDQYKALTSNGRSVQLQLFVERDNKRIQVGKLYDVKQQKSSFDFSMEKLCGEMTNFWDEVYGKDIWPGCKVTVFKEVKGQKVRDYKYREWNCKRPERAFVCSDDGIKGK